MPAPNGFRYRPYSAVEAESLKDALMALFSRTDRRGMPVPDSTYIELRRIRGDGGYEVAVPLEHIDQLINAYHARIRIKVEETES